MQGGLDTGSDVDFYKFRTPKTSDGQPTVMTAMVWGLPGGLEPQITIYDDQGNVVAAQVLVAEGGEYTVQVADADSHAAYYIEVSAADPADAASNTGNYNLAIDFGTHLIALNTLVANGSVAAGHLQDGGTLHVDESQLFHVILSVASPAGAGQLTIYDPNGTAIQTLTVAAGSTQSATFVLLQVPDPNAGYTFLFTPAAGTSTPLTYTLQAIALSDPIGPQPVDTTLAGGGPGDSDQGGTGFTIPTTPVSGVPFWWQAGYFAFVAFGGMPAPENFSVSSGNGTASERSLAADNDSANNAPPSGTAGSGSAGGTSATSARNPTETNAPSAGSGGEGNSTTGDAGRTLVNAFAGGSATTASGGNAAGSTATAHGANAVQLAGGSSTGIPAGSAAGADVSASADARGTGAAGDTSQGLSQRTSASGTGGSDGVGDSRAAESHNVPEGNVHGEPAVYFFDTVTGILAPPDYSAAFMTAGMDTPIAYPHANQEHLAQTFEKSFEEGPLVIYIVAGLGISATLRLLGTRLAPVRSPHHPSLRRHEETVPARGDSST